MIDALRHILKRCADRSVIQNECLIYTKQKGPYIWIRNEHSVMEGLHRLSFRFANGPLNKDEIIRHTCDNPRCWAPIHLIKGTDADNIKDKMQRNRDWNCIGEDHWQSKLTDAQVGEILISLNKGELQRTIACRYGVSQTLISMIHLRKVRDRRRPSLT